MNNDTLRLKESREALVVALAFAAFLYLAFFTNYGVICRLLRGESLDIWWAVFCDAALLYFALNLSALMPGIVINTTERTVSFPNLAYRNLFRRTIRLQEVREIRDEMVNYQVNEGYEAKDYFQVAVYGTDVAKKVEANRAAAKIGNTLRAMLGLKTGYKMIFFGDFGSAKLQLYSEANYMKLRYAIDHVMGISKEES